MLMGVGEERPRIYVFRVYYILFRVEQVLSKPSRDSNHFTRGCGGSRVSHILSVMVGEWWSWEDSLKHVSSLPCPLWSMCGLWLPANTFEETSSEIKNPRVALSSDTSVCPQIRNHTNYASSSTSLPRPGSSALMWSDQLER